MSPGVFLTLTATVAVAALTPGPAVTAIVARAVTDGTRPAMAINAGVVTGDLLFFALAAAGMAAAAQSLGDLFAVLRIVGAAYLAWQGIRLWRAAAARRVGRRHRPRGALLAQLRRRPAAHGRATCRRCSSTPR